MADSGRARPADPDAADCRTASPLAVKKRAQQSPGLRPKYQSAAPGHCLRKVTLTKPTYCHSCSDFIWGLIGFLCEGKTVKEIYRAPRVLFILYYEVLIEKTCST